MSKILFLFVGAVKFAVNCAPKLPHKHRIFVTGLFRNLAYGGGYFILTFLDAAGDEAVGVDRVVMQTEVFIFAPMANDRKNSVSLDERFLRADRIASCRLTD